MAVRFHAHAVERMQERGATVDEATAAVEWGEEFPAKFGRTGFRRNFAFNAEWQGKRFGTKQLEVYAVREGLDWFVVTVITKYF